MGKGVCGLAKGAGERIDKGIVQWFGHVERMKNDSIAKRVYVEECAGSRSVGWPQKRCIDTVKDCLKKKFGKQGKWFMTGVNGEDFLTGNMWDISRGMNL